MKLALDNLKSIYEAGVILPGFALRGRPESRTIYGPDPAVCFSEQPLREFAEYVRIRDDSRSVTGYGVAINKKDLFSEGGLPVVSGLEKPYSLEKGAPDFVEAQRSLHPQLGLPWHEQYRFVNFNLHREPPSDWTHEREWRWKKQTHIGIDGFPFAGSGASSTSLGMSKGRFAFVVESDKDIASVRSWGLDTVRAQIGRRRYGERYDLYLETLYLPKLIGARIFSLETVRRECAAGRDLFAKIETQ